MESWVYPAGIPTKPPHVVAQLPNYIIIGFINFIHIKVLQRRISNVPSVFRADENRSEALLELNNFTQF